MSVSFVPVVMMTVGVSFTDSQLRAGTLWESSTAVRDFCLEMGVSQADDEARIRRYCVAPAIRPSTKRT